MLRQRDAEEAADLREAELVVARDEIEPCGIGAGGRVVDVEVRGVKRAVERALADVGGGQVDLEARAEMERDEQDRGDDGERCGARAGSREPLAEAPGREKYQRANEQREKS